MGWQALRGLPRGDLVPFVEGPRPDQVPSAYLAAHGVYVLEARRVWRAGGRAIPRRRCSGSRCSSTCARRTRLSPRGAANGRHRIAQPARSAADLWPRRSGGAGAGAWSATAPAGSAASGRSRIAGGRQGRTELLSVPAVPCPRSRTKPAQATPTCGAFLVGWVESSDLKTAACYGAAAASVALEVTAWPIRVRIWLGCAIRVTAGCVSEWSGLLERKTF